MARPLRLQFEGATYHLVVRANSRQPLFRDDQDRRRYLELLGRYQRQFGFKVYSYLLIGRQVHLLLETPRGNIGKIMQCLGTSYSSYFNRRHRRRGTLLEGRYRSYLVENRSDLPQITRYIHRSQFQPSLRIRKRRDYRWSSYRIFLGKKDSDLVETEPVLGRFGRGVRGQRKRYQEFVEKDGPRGNPFPHPVHAQSNPGSSNNIVGQKVISQPEHAHDIGEESSLRKAEGILREVTLSLDSSASRDLREKRKNALARHVAMYLIRMQTGLPLRSIGELLGVKAPAVALGIGRVERLLKQEEFSNKFRHLFQGDFLPSSDKGQYLPVQGELADGARIT